MVRIHLLCASTLCFGLIGCVTTSGEAEQKARAINQSNFGNVPIVRVGMLQDDVEKLLDHPTIVGKGADGKAASALTYFPMGLHVEYYIGIVKRCQSALPANNDANRNPVHSDSELTNSLQAGMTVREVERKIGKPSCGYENVIGQVFLIYPQARLEVGYVDGRMTNWQKVQ